MFIIIFVYCILFINILLEAIFKTNKIKQYIIGSRTCYILSSRRSQITYNFVQLFLVILQRAISNFNCKQ